MGFDLAHGEWHALQYHRVSTRPRFGTFGWQNPSDCTDLHDARREAGSQGIRYDSAMRIRVLAHAGDRDPMSEFDEGSR